MRKLLFRIIWDSYDLGLKYRPSALRRLLVAEQRTLPCSECRVHWRGELEASPLSAVRADDDGQALAEWLCDRHNAVNGRRGVCLTTREAAAARLAAWTAVCSPYSIWDALFMRACNYPSRGSYQAHVARRRMSDGDGAAAAAGTDVDGEVRREYGAIVAAYADMYDAVAEICEHSPPLFRKIGPVVRAVAARTRRGEFERACERGVGGGEHAAQCERVLHIAAVCDAHAAWCASTDQQELQMTLHDAIERYMVGFSDEDDKARLRYEYQLLLRRDGDGGSSKRRGGVVVSA